MARYREFLGFIGVLVTLFAMPADAVAQSSTIFTYQGRLSENGAAAAGPVDLEFRLYDAPTDGTLIGSALFLTNFSGFELDGSFTVDLDFGAGAFTGAGRWLEILVDDTPLSPRQPIRPAPYAIHSLNGGTNGWTDKGSQTHTMDDTGIGTTAPEAPLHVMEGSAGTVTAHSRSIGVFERSGSGYLSILTPDAYERGLLFGDPEDYVNGGILYNSPSHPDGFGFRTGGNVTRMTITSNGNVGVGTTDPQHPLHVNGILRIGGTTVGINGANGDYLYIQPNSTGLASFTFHQEKLRFVNAYGEIMRLFRGGDVHIGATSSPGARLGVTRSDSGTIIKANGSGAGTGLQIGGVSLGVQVNSLDSTGTAFGAASINGSARAASFYGISSSPMITSWNDGTGVALQLRGPNDASLTGNGLFVSGDTAGLNIVMDNNEIIARNNGAVSILHLNADGGEVRVGSNSSSAFLSTPILQVTGGADLSEMFDIGGTVDIEPGMVVSIDPENPGQLVPAVEAYDPKVAGIISGAGGVATGMRMGHDGTIADGDHPVALSGRVYCLVDASEHGIEPGDMLTTSETPGHAMKVTDRDRAHGAVIGKAMTSLKRGETRLVLVLVSLQ